MTTLVNIRNLNLAFGQRAIFKDAELTINKGDRIGLIGLNGQGKSTLFKILTKDVTPDQSTPAFEYETSNQKFDIFLIPQELDIKKYSHLTIEEFYLTFYPKLYELYFKMQKDIANEELIHQFEELGGWDIQNNYISYLKGFDLNELDRTVEHLSGGEQKKMALSIGLSGPAEFYD